MLPLLLGGAALWRCDNCSVLNAASAAEVTTLALQRLFPRALQPCYHRHPNRDGDVRFVLPLCLASFRDLGFSDYMHRPQLSANKQRKLVLTLVTTITASTCPRFQKKSRPDIGREMSRCRIDRTSRRFHFSEFTPSSCHQSGARDRCLRSNRRSAAQ